MSSVDEPGLGAVLFFEHQDKVIHFFEYLIFSIILFYSYKKSCFFPRKISLFLVVFITASLYGASDEYHQSFLKYRNADLYDWIFDSLGSLTALLFLWFRSNHYQKNALK
jgi:VanZ family protein